MNIPEGVRLLSISQVTNVIKLRLEEHFAMVWAAGEISNFTKAASGHLYFNLKDAGAVLRCVMFRGSALRLKFPPKDGLEVMVRGNITVYPARGEYQLIIEELSPKGLGQAELALNALKEKLLKKGYFDPKRKRPLPRFPRRIALIASPTGAALRDMLEILSQRWPHAEVIVRPSRVQGEGSGGEIAANIRMLHHLHMRKHLFLDAIVLGRGGGSTEDLWAFNEEIVADAIFLCGVPVVSAIGHETDVTVADLVADHRAETPSAAIAALTPDRVQLTAELRRTTDRMKSVMQNRLRLCKQRVQQLADRPALRKPLDLIHQLEQDLDKSAARLDRAMKVRLQRKKDQLEALTEQLEGLSPLKVLKRGYTLTRQDNGSLVRTLDQLNPGDRITTRLAQGEVISRVEELLPPLEKPS